MICPVVKHRRTFVLPLTLTTLLLVAFLTREQLKRAFVALSIYRAHIMTPPPLSPEESRLRRWREYTRFYWDFAGVPINRAKRLKLLEPTLKPLVREISRREALGEDMQVPQHTYREIRWWLNFTPNVEMTRTRVAALHQALVTPVSRSPVPDSEQDDDGSWARGINLWYLKLYYSVDKLQSCHAPPMRPLTYLDRINSPVGLHATLETDLHDEFTETGVFNREELDETFSALARMLFGSAPIACYQFNPALGGTLRDFVNEWQNPATGYWGQWLVDRDGKIWKMDDMAMTFHVVSDLHGQVNHLDQIAKRTLQLDDVDFPAGIRFNGHYENHLNWDVIKILRIAWPTLDNATREEARNEISRMLAWCLSSFLPARWLLQSERSG